MEKRSYNFTQRGTKSNTPTERGVLLKVVRTCEEKLKLIFPILSFSWMTSLKWLFLITVWLRHRTKGGGRRILLDFLTIKGIQFGPTSWKTFDDLLTINIPNHGLGRTFRVQRTLLPYHHRRNDTGDDSLEFPISEKLTKDTLSAVGPSSVPVTLPIIVIRTKLLPLVSSGFFKIKYVFKRYLRSRVVDGKPLGSRKKYVYLRFWVTH